jgi:hypothetical protein
MTNNTFVVTQKVTGAERKVIASVIAQAIDEQVKYAGAPSMAYHIGQWRIEKSGVVRSPEVEIANIETIKQVIDALKVSGFTAEGDLSIILSAELHTGGTLRNLCNLISSKGMLLQKALSRHTEAIPQALVETINEVPIDTIEGFMKVYNSGDLWLEHLPNEIGFCFFNATLNFDEVFAQITLAQKLNEMAIIQKHIGSKQKLIINEAYSFRVWLIRLGFIGDIYKTSRKALLSKLEGNRAYRGGVTNESN